MANKQDSNDATRYLMHAVDEQVTFYNSSVSNVTRIATTNSVVNIAAKIGGVRLNLRTSLINAVLNTGVTTLTANYYLHSKTINYTRTSAVTNLYAGESTVMNDFKGTSSRENNYKSNVFEKNIYDMPYYKSNLYKATRINVEDVPYFDYVYSKGKNDDTHTSHIVWQAFEEISYIEGGADSPLRKNNWFRFPESNELDELIDAQSKRLMLQSREYIDNAEYVSVLKKRQEGTELRQLMSASIPQIGRTNKLVHITPLADQPLSMQAACDMGASVKLTLPRGARQTFEFFPKWFSSFYFGDSTSYYFGSKNEIYTNKYCTTIKDQYSLVEGSSLQHFSYKDQPAVIQHEGGMELNHLKVDDKTKIPKLRQQIAIRTEAHGEEGIFMRSSSIQLCAPNVTLCSTKFRMLTSASIIGAHGENIVLSADKAISIHAQDGIDTSSEGTMLFQSKGDIRFKNKTRVCLDSGDVLIS